MYRSKVEQTVTPMIDVDGLMSSNEEDESIQFVLYSGGSRTPRNMGYYSRCELAKAKCVSFADVSRIEVNESTIDKIHNDHKPINPYKSQSAFSKAARRLPSSSPCPTPSSLTPPAADSGASPASVEHDLYSTKYRGSIKWNEASPILSTSPILSADSFVIDEILTAPPPKRRSSIFSLFRSSVGEKNTTSPSSRDAKGKPPIDPTSPSDDGAHYDDHHATGDYFKFKIKLKDGDIIHLKVFEKIYIPPINACFYMLKIVLYCPLALHEDRRVRRGSAIRS